MRMYDHNRHVHVYRSDRGFVTSNTLGRSRVILTCNFSQIPLSRVRSEENNAFD